MTKNEAGVVVKMISTFYPNEFTKTTPEQMKYIVEMWAATCERYRPEQVTAALQQFMATDLKGYAPKPGQLINLIAAPEDDHDLNEGEAWNLILKAVSNGIYGAEDEYNQLPELLQKAIGSPFIIHEMAMREVTSVDESNFKRNYRTVLERERLKRRMPPSTWKRLAGGERETLPG